MPTFTHRQISFMLICLFLLAFTSACGSNGTHATAAPTNTQTNSAPTTSTPAQATSTGTPTAVTNADCPAPGTGHAASLPSLHLGTDQTIVYLVGSPDAASSDGQLIMLKRYDVQTRTVTTITGGAIQTAQISQDGQWILLSVMEHAVSKIQLVRMDGKDRQTLYCAPQNSLIDPSISTGMQWSPDQKHIIFAQGANSPSPSFYMLDLTSGAVQQELSPTDTNQSLLPIKWLDKTRVCVETTPARNGLPSALYLLDTSKGPNQHTSDMQLIKNISYGNTWDFDTSADGGTLYIGMITPLQSTPYFQSEIDADSINGSGGKQILLNSTMTITNVRVINASSLMFISFTDNPTKEQVNNIGWWKVNSDGSGLTRLNTVSNESAGAGSSIRGPFNPYTQNPWSNFSRDGSLYTDGLFYGSLTGGPLTSYTSENNVTLVGWTTM